MTPSPMPPAVQTTASEDEDMVTMGNQTDPDDNRFPEDSDSDEDDDGKWVWVQEIIWFCFLLCKLNLLNETQSTQNLIMSSW